MTRKKELNTLNKLFMLDSSAGYAPLDTFWGINVLHRQCPEQYWSSICHLLPLLGSSSVPLFYKSRGPRASPWSLLTKLKKKKKCHKLQWKQHWPLLWAWTLKPSYVLPWSLFIYRMLTLRDYLPEVLPCLVLQLTFIPRLSAWGLAFSEAHFKCSH